MSGTGKELSNSYSTGGGGVHFENRVQASFVVLMLTGGFSPCLPSWPINDIKLQGKYLDYDTDDLIVYVKQPGSDREAKLLGQVKHSIKITEGNKVFGEVIQAAWNDFNNKKIFNENLDVLALITGPLSASDTDNVRALLNQAHNAKDADNFFMRISLAKFTSNGQRKKLDAFRTHLRNANQNEDITDEQLWRFLKSFHLLLYDLDIKGVTLSLLHSLIGQYAHGRAEELLALIEKEVTYKSENAGSITIDNIPVIIQSAFKEPVKRKIPKDLIISASEKTKSDWNTHKSASRLVIANLLGSWNEKYESDIDVVSQIAGEDFARWVSEIREILQYPDSPIALKNGVWAINKREELWTSLGPRIFDDTLETFKRCAINILTEPDPKFSLPTEKRFSSRIYGKEMKYSESLRSGIAESLALLGSYNKYLSHSSLDKPKNIANEIVRKVFENADWRLWGSLNYLLPLLAEAAPEQFLTAIEGTLHVKPCPLDELFAQEGNGNAGSNYLTGLLWALETLAWDEKYLVRVTIVLGELAARDPGGNWANRPSNSLTTIFLPWLPQTTASVMKKKVAVKTLLMEVPEIGWNLLMDLLPDQRQTSLGSHKPKWRMIIPEDKTKGVLKEEYWQQISIYSDFAVNVAFVDIIKLTELVSHLDCLPSLSFEKVLTHLSSDDILGKPEHERINLWMELVKLASKHRRYAQADWALKPDLVLKVEETAANLAPVSPLNLHRLLFDNRETDLYEETGNWREQRQQLEHQRNLAIKEILDYGGIDAVIQFSETVKSPSLVGYSLGLIGESGVDLTVLPFLLNTEDIHLSQFSNAFVRARYQSKGWEWVDSIEMKEWSYVQISQFLGLLPFTKDTWERVNLWLGDFEEEYWVRTNVDLYEIDSEIGMAIEKLIQYGRPNASIKCLYELYYYNQKLDNDRSVKALLAAISSKEPSYSMDAHHSVELIKALQNSSDTNSDALFSVEWAYLPLLDKYSGASPKLLQNRLASDSNFFSEVIRLVYRSKKVGKIDIEPTEHQRALALNAYRLLEEWKVPPGTKKDGSFSKDDFKKWLDLSKIACEETGHLEVALSHIGKVLFYCPPEPNGIWIDKTVAESLNSRNAEKMRNGFALSVFNSRGAHFVDPSGKPERDLAEIYRYKADDVENAGYHRFAATIRGIAESYESDADRIIQEALM
ncbi:hypothetical protein [Paenisporosarcina sp.]|uniref:hypothetical protein n=1 Tax=Paenisporosarcina sp. TaxID=1932001 RepID=UPI003C738E55